MGSVGVAGVPGWAPGLVPVIPPHPAEPDGRWLAGWRHRGYLELDARGGSPGEARAMARRLLPWWGLGDLLDPAELVATAMATSSMAAIREAGWRGGMPPARLWLLGGEASVAAVSWHAAPGEPGLPDAGQGMELVARLAQRSDRYVPPYPWWGTVTRALIT